MPEIIRKLKPPICRQPSISQVETPEGEDINSLSISHEKEIFTHSTGIQERNPFFIFN
jgi:DNA primase